MGMNTAISYSLSPLSSPSRFYDCCMTRRRDTSTSKLHFAPPVIYYLFRTSSYSFLGCKGHVFLLVGAAVPGPRDGVAGGVLAAAGAELECDAAADGGVDAVSTGSGVSEEPAVSQGAVAGIPAVDGFGEESAVDAGNPLLLPIVPRHRISGSGARSEGQLALEERATEVGGEAAEIAYLLP
jgi:hypothetical protein